MSNFYAILTEVGEAKIANAHALGETLLITHMAVGDGNGNPTTPDTDQTALVNERRRAPLNELKVDPQNPSAIIAEQVIPESIGGWWIREIGLFDDDGDLVAVANCPDTYKPVLAEGSGRTQVIRMILIVSSAAAVQLQINPAIVLATRQYVDTTVADELRKRDFKESCRVATTGNLTELSGLLTLDGVPLAAGNRVLVKDQTSAAQNGIYVAAAGAWARALDADSGTKLTAGAVVPVEAGAINADTLWMLATDGAIVIGATGLMWQWAGGRNAPTAAQFDTSRKVATTEFVQRAQGSFSGTRVVSDTEQLTPSDCGKLLSGTIELAGKVLTLPLASEVQLGAAIHFSNGNTASPVAISANTGDIIAPAPGGGAGTVTQIFVEAVDSVTLVKISATAWRIVAGSQQMKHSGLLRASIAGSGWQRLPSGLIIQWGSTGGINQGASLPVTFPIAFPSQCLRVVGSANSSGNNTLGYSASAISYSATGFLATNNSGSSGLTTMSYLAIGF